MKREDIRNDVWYYIVNDFGDSIISYGNIVEEVSEKCIHLFIRSNNLFTTGRLMDYLGIRKIRLATKEEIRTALEAYGKTYKFTKEDVLTHKISIFIKDEKQGKELFKFFGLDYSLNILPAYLRFYTNINQNPDYTWLHESYLKPENQKFGVNYEINIEQLKIEEMYYIELNDWYKIVEVACDSWKSKLLKFSADNLKDGKVEVNQEYLDAMLSAATVHKGVDQKKVIEEVFGIDRFADLRKAHKEGKTIEFRSPGMESWTTIDKPNWGNGGEYRVKPEIQPFTFEDRELFRGKWVKNKEHNAEFLITGISNKGIYIGEVHHNYGNLLKLFTFLDGTPCGKS